jgi:hypothetical protein
VLALRVKPWALVRVDGLPLVPAAARKAAGSGARSTSVTSEVVELAPGSHAIVFEHPEYEPFRRVIAIRSGEKLSLAVDLKDEGVRRRK